MILELEEKKRKEKKFCLKGETLLHMGVSPQRAWVLTLEKYDGPLRLLLLVFNIWTKELSLGIFGLVTQYGCDGDHDARNLLLQRLKDWKNLVGGDMLRPLYCKLRNGRFDSWVRWPHFLIRGGASLG